MEESFGNLILKVSTALSNYVNKNFADSGIDLNTQQMVILMVLWANDGQRQQDLADRTHKDKTSVTRLLAGMEKKKLIRRRQDKHDSRQKLVYVTEKSLAIKKQVLHSLRNDFAYIQKDIDAQELSTCVNVLESAYQNLLNTQ